MTSIVCFVSHQKLPAVIMAVFWRPMRVVCTKSDVPVAPQLESIVWSAPHLSTI